MALKKSKTVKGYPYEYWRIVEYSANFNRNDAVVTFALYKDAATRESNPNDSIESFKIDLGPSFHEVNYVGNADTVKNIKLKEAYTTFKAMATAEAEKPVEEQNGQLSFFADAVDA